MYKLWRVATGICHWPDSWQEGETITFTLYDSPTKTKKLYSRTPRLRPQVVQVGCRVRYRLATKPGQEFYFELTHNGGGDNKVNAR